VMRVFNRQDWLRANRARARLKFLVDKVGIDEFREMVEQEMKGDWIVGRDFAPDPLLFEHDEEPNAPAPPSEYSSPNGDLTEFNRFREGNVLPQRQEGFNTVQIKITRGDLTPEQFRGIAQIMRDFSGGYARTTVHQNFLLRWVRDESVYDVWQRLVELGLGDVGPDTVTDVVSCPGTDSCKLGITSSMGLNKAVQTRLEEMQIEDPLTKKVHIKMSGCPNGCSQHHIANIGFYGAAMKMDGHQVPAYIAHVGGNFEGGVVAMGKRLRVRLPAKRVPDAVERWIRLYEAERTDGETFNAYVERMGLKHFEDAVRDLAMPIDFSLETMNHFIDWNRNVPFQVIRGEGECAV
jgi:sulfite reductase beta subunit-like hemoprotein